MHLKLERVVFVTNYELGHVNSLNTNTRYLSLAKFRPTEMYLVGLETFENLT